MWRDCYEASQKATVVLFSVYLSADPFNNKNVSVFMFDTYVGLYSPLAIWLRAGILLTLSDSAIVRGLTNSDRRL